MNIFQFIIYCQVMITMIFADDVDYSCLHASSWLMNTNNHYNSYFAAKTDTLTSSLSNGKWSVTNNRIPHYDREFTEDDINRMNTRPKASSDFDTGKTTAVAGSTYIWGQDLGYKSTACNLGYWPPGPSCPTKSALTYTFDLTPGTETRAAGCYTPGGSLGRFVNGVGIFNSKDGQSYNNGDIWHNNAPEFEIYDLDPCWGHAAGGDYHHHNHPYCLAERLGDNGTSHSPIYGWIGDGYPLFGPYQAKDTLVQSCWKKRDYSASSATGCSDGKRSCQLQDQWDYTKGTKSVTSGPSLTTTVNSLSGNAISAASGIYFEDMYYDSACTSLGDEYLDAYNGHSHDPYGWHYHVTIDSNLLPVFPYIIGPKFKGCVASTGYSCCSSVGDKQCSQTSVCGSQTGTTSYACSSSTSLTSSPTKTPTKTPTRMPTESPTEQTVVISFDVTFEIDGIVSSDITTKEEDALIEVLATELDIPENDLNINSVSRRKLLLGSRKLTSATIDASIVTLLTSSFNNGDDMIDHLQNELTTALADVDTVDDWIDKCISSGSTTITSSLSITFQTPTFSNEDITSIHSSSPTAASHLSSSKSSSSSSTMLIGIVVGVGGGVICILLIVLMALRKVGKGIGSV